MSDETSIEERREITRKWRRHVRACAFWFQEQLSLILRT